MYHIKLQNVIQLATNKSGIIFINNPDKTHFLKVEKCKNPPKGKHLLDTKKALKINFLCTNTYLILTAIKNSLKVS